MTQVISVITHEYALLASDRRLTFGEGPRLGEVADDDTCKLVSVCNTFGIGYSGLAHFDRIPTHEWIAKILASQNCRNAWVAGELLKKRAAAAISALNLGFEFRQEFLMAGWGRIPNPDRLGPFMVLVSNARDATGRQLPRPSKEFLNLFQILPIDRDLIAQSIGQEVTKSRAWRLIRNLKNLAQRKISPDAALRLLVDEIVYTSEFENNPTVGSKILGFCIPRRSLEQQAATGQTMLVAQRPDETSASFTYFESGYSELRQFGPTFVCGENAFSDIKTENDPQRNYQSSGIKILSLGKPKK